jgi:Ca-activated chloride channel homolog
MRGVIAFASVALAGAGMWACSGSSDSTSSVPTGAGGGGGYNSGSGGALGFDAATSGSGGASFGGGGGYGGAAGAGEPRNSHGSDAGADGAAEDAGDASSCDGLDQTQQAVFYLSADDSNSMASPAIARRLIQQKKPVPVAILRTYEFLNYYNVGYAPAPLGTLSIVPELRVGDDPGSYELQLGVVSNAAPKPRRPMVITFVLDTSGSMTGEPIDLERQTVKAIAQQLGQGDLVSMVTWNTAQTAPLDSYAVTGPSDSKVLGLATALQASGGTDLNAGLELGYQIAQKSFDPQKLNRVVLISDGMANVGVTDETIIGNGAALNDGDGVYLVGVGVGDGVNDTLMNAVTDAGRGAYVYLDGASEVTRMFGPRFDEVMDVAARAVQVELRMPWYMGIQKFYGEEYSTNPQEIEPQHLAPDDAMVFSQLVSPCSVTEVADSDPIEVIARWETPLNHAKKEVAVETSFGELLAQTPEHMDKAKAIISYAEALKKSVGAKADLALAKQLADAADPAGTDPELSEIRGLIELAMGYYP